MQEPLLLGIDLGTGSTKATLVSAAGDVIAETECRYPGTIAAQPGEVDPSGWWSAVVRAVRLVRRDHPQDVAAIGLSGQMHGVVLLDSALQPVRPAITWIDTRSTELVPQFVEAVGAERRALTNPATPGMAALSLMWLNQHEPRALARTSVVLQPKDWLGTRLTGEVCSDASDASGTLLWDFSEHTWNEELVVSLGLSPEILPPILPATAIRGPLCVDAADELSLRPGIPIAVGLADTAAALLGNGCIKPDQIQVAVGSGGQLCAIVDEPAADPRALTYLLCGPLPSNWYVMAAVASAGLTLDWVRGVFGLSWRDLYDEAFSAQPAPDLVFHPYINGERTPHMEPRLRADWIGLSGEHQRPQLLRAALEGAAFAIRDAWDVLAQDRRAGAPVRLTGGGNRDARWRQLLADVLQARFVVSRDRGGSGRGAALVAGCAAGWFTSLNDAPSTLSEDEFVVPDADADAAAVRERLERFRWTMNSQRLNQRP